jgi:hypothetical protein
MMFPRSAVFLAVAALAGCAAAPAPAPYIKPPQVTVSNFTGDTIAKVVARPCETRDPAQGRVLATDLKHNRSIALTIATNCSDLEAFNREDRLVGRQLRVSLPPDLDWRIY